MSNFALTEYFPCFFFIRCLDVEVQASVALTVYFPYAPSMVPTAELRAIDVGVCYQEGTFRTIYLGIWCTFERCRIFIHILLENSGMTA